MPKPPMKLVAFVGVFFNGNLMHVWQGSNTECSQFEFCVKAETMSRELHFIILTCTQAWMFADPTHGPLIRVFLPQDKCNHKILFSQNLFNHHILLWMEWNRKRSYNIVVGVHKCSCQYFAKICSLSNHFKMQRDKLKMCSQPLRLVR
jgi:hypothetical protein